MAVKIHLLALFGGLLGVVIFLILFRTIPWFADFSTFLGLIWTMMNMLVTSEPSATSPQMWVIVIDCVVAFLLSTLGTNIVIQAYLLRKPRHSSSSDDAAKIDAKKKKSRRKTVVGDD